ncbi:TonB-dependent receptor [Novosphingobium sediminis]|uniref:TonB-dependent receptor n=1 Tax=Novosphingobium sediminis TaxID=707214 RepID=A0A512AJB1_9SPHN|nr:TonB-dependent receptor [Novosphingobium sediminis]GEN99778.1 TonB-dependent receptor [Novosphingobium sediminis]
MRFPSKFLAAASPIAFCVTALNSPAFAQSTGSVEFDKEIVVTGTRGTQQVAGVASPDTPKARAVLTQETIQRQNPGQTILDTINLIPGVSFQNNDAYGSAGGTLSIRGFDASRISLTFDGVPLNDSGNYAIYSNQQLDPEIISEVNVNLGTTDVDSPTASAVGGTINYRSKTPDHDLGLLVSGSVGEYNFRRGIVKVETGDLTASGTRAWFSASTAKNDNPFNNYGKISKQQYNGKIYQPLAGDDFIAIAAHYNQNRNNFFGSLPLRNDPTRTVGSASSNRFPGNSDERGYTVNVPCTVALGVTGVADSANTCGTEFDRRYNPSNTGNVRISSRFTLADHLVLTVDPSYQWVKANGGGTVTGLEGVRTIAGTAYTGFVGGKYYFGKDLNGDGDALDAVSLLAPSHTQTRRYGLIASLKWDINPENTVRIAYTYDGARHRQTGEVGTLQFNGEPTDVFPINNPLRAANGVVVQKRDRLSYAILHQVAGEYRGEFFGGNLVVNAGVRAPFFKRNLTNYCFATSASGNVDCFGQDAALNAGYAAANPYSYSSTTNKFTGYAAPQQRLFNFNRVLPNVGFVYKLGSGVSLFANYSKGLSVPGTDSLYNAFVFPLGTEQALPKPETTDNFDGGVRYRSGKVQGEISGFYNKFQNRLASAYDPELDVNVYRNLGDVKKYGFDGYVSYQPIPALSLYAFASALKSEIQNDVQINATTFAATTGKRESGIPTYSYGGAVRGSVGPFDLGVTFKRTGPRYYNDENLPVVVGGTEVYPAQIPAYNLVNLDARFNLKGIGRSSYIQLNVYNLFDEFYVGGVGGTLLHTATYFAQIGAPRTVSGTLVIGF